MDVVAEDEQEDPGGCSQDDGVSGGSFLHVPATLTGGVVRLDAVCDSLPSPTSEQPLLAVTDGSEVGVLPLHRDPVLLLPLPVLPALLGGVVRLNPIPSGLPPSTTLPELLGEDDELQDGANGDRSIELLPGKVPVSLCVSPCVPCAVVRHGPLPVPPPIVGGVVRLLGSVGDVPPPPGESLLPHGEPL